MKPKFTNWERRNVVKNTVHSGYYHDEVRNAYENIRARIKSKHDHIRELCERARQGDVEARDFLLETEGLKIYTPEERRSYHG